MQASGSAIAGTLNRAMIGAAANGTQHIRMSAEMLTAVASLATAVIIAATAVAAMIQLRHMRAGNAIEAILSFRNIIEDDQHRRAMNMLRAGDLQRAMEDPQFRRFLYRRMKQYPNPDVPQSYSDLMDCAVTMGNCFELIGGMIRNKVAPPDIFLPNYWWMVVGTWDRMDSWIAAMREYSGSDGMLVDFEFLTVLSREWGQNHPDSYAHGFPRMPIRNTYSLADEAWAHEENAFTSASA